MYVGPPLNRMMRVPARLTVADMSWPPIPGIASGYRLDSRSSKSAKIER